MKSTDPPFWTAFLRVSPKLSEKSDDEIDQAVARLKGDREFVDHDTFMAELTKLDRAEATRRGAW